MSRTGRTPVLATLALLLGGLAAPSPAAAAPDAPGGAPHVRVAKVSATSAATPTGTTVDARLRLKNVTPTRKKERSTRLFLTNANGTYRLGKAPVPAIKGKGRVTVRGAYTVRPAVPAGTYAVRACRGKVAAELCLTSAPTVTVGPAALVASSDAIGFAGIEVGTTSVRREVTLTNRGQTPTGVLATSVAGDRSFSVAASTCAATLAAGASCTVSLAFAPSARGSVSGTLSVSGASSTVTSVALTGTGLAPAKLVAAATYDFGDTLVGGTSAPAELVVTNRGDVTSGTPAVSVSPAGDFAVAATTCTTPLAPGASCSVSVTVSPSAPGARTADLSVAATPGTAAVVALHATGLAPASLSFGPGPLSFGDQLVDGTTDTQTLTLTNDGDVASGVPSVSLTGDDADQFTIVDNGCSAAVPAGGSCDVDVAFAPTTAGAASAGLTATATPGGTTSAALGGTGLAPAALAISESAYDFAYTDDAVDQHTFVVTNEGDVPARDLTVDVDGDAFGVAASTCGSVLAARSSCTVEVAYTRSGTAQQSAGLSVSGTPGGTVDADLTGSPVALSLTPALHDVGDVLVGQYSDASRFILANHRRTSVFINTLVTTGYVNAGSSCFGQTIPAGGTCAVDLRIFAAAAGSLDGWARYYASGDQAGANLVGRGVTPATLTAGSSTESFGVWVPGATATRTITVLNTGQRATASTPTLAITGPDASSFAQAATTCASPLASGSSCTFDVAFTPTAFGARSATATISGASNAPAVTLSGSGAPAGLSVAPSPYDFGSVPVGSRSSTVMLTISNTLDVSRRLSSITIPGGFDLDFSGSCVNGKILLPAHDTCTIGYVFAPTAPGFVTRTSPITYEGGITVQAEFSGTGTAAPALRGAQDPETGSRAAGRTIRIG